MEVVIMKTCSNCHREQELTAFYKDTYSDHYFARCKACLSAIRKLKKKHILYIIKGGETV